MIHSAEQVGLFYVEKVNKLTVHIGECERWEILE